jgi:hypothetical protein
MKCIPETNHATKYDIYVFLKKEVMRICKLKKDRQHNDQRKKDKQRSLKLYKENQRSSNMNPTHNWWSKPVVNSIAPEEEAVLAPRVVSVCYSFY